MRRPRVPVPARAVHPVRAAALAAAAALVLSACSGEAGAGAATSAGDPESCPGEVVDVVVSVGHWGDAVRTLGGDCATVTTIVDSAAGDPHEFEPTTGDLAAFEDAELVVVNGAGYDSWASSALAGLDPAPAVVEAAEVAGIEGGADGRATGTNPHLWYSPADVQATAEAVTAALSELSPDAASTFTASAESWAAELKPYRDAVAELRATATGRSYAATETVFDLMAAELGLTDATPPGYRDSASNETDPAPGDIAAFETALGDGSVDVLVHNTQTEGSIPAQLRDAAEDAGVPVVDVTESAPPGAGSFVAWQLDQLQQLSDALGGA
ncbi:MAG: hypothetical protein JWR62_1277 [Modestobacter sp.]|nr:hypothetical protein [Modestobacter sp.]